MVKHFDSSILRKEAVLRVLENNCLLKEKRKPNFRPLSSRASSGWNQTKSAELFMKYLAVTVIKPIFDKRRTACVLDSNNTVLRVAICNEKSALAEYSIDLHHHIDWTSAKCKVVETRLALTPVRGGLPHTPTPGHSTEHV